MILEESSESKSERARRYDKGSKIEYINKLKRIIIECEVKGKQEERLISPHVKEIAKSMSTMRKSKDHLILSKLLSSLSDEERYEFPQS